MSELPFTLETELERRIGADPDWQRGIEWGEPRPGHWEGSVGEHIAEVLDNVDAIARSPDDRERLRLIALVHDALKYDVDRSRPRVGANHHAMRARRFAERYVDDEQLLDLIELHDEAYNSWRAAAASGNWERAEQRIDRLLERIGDTLPLYLDFYRADNRTASKDPEPLSWFEDQLARRGAL